MTDKPLSVVQAITEVMREVTKVAKSDRNESQGFSFRGIDATVNAVGPALRKHGVIVVPIVESTEYGTVEVGRNRTQMGHVRVTVTYRWYGPDGSSIDTRTVGEAFDAGDKASPKAMSVAFRIALLQALALPTDEPDVDSHAYERARPGPTRDDAIAAAHKAIAAAPTIERLRELLALVEQRKTDGLITEEDATSLGAAIEGRLVEISTPPGERPVSDPRES